MSLQDCLSPKLVIINLLDSIEDFRKIPDDIEKELLIKIESYWYQMETEFETRMDASKTGRIDITDWDLPRLWFKIIRHPGGLRSQTWVYDFDTNEAVLASESVIPLATRYTKKMIEDDARAIVTAICSDIFHPAVQLVARAQMRGRIRTLECALN